jgi:hypothetical protein
VAMRMIPIPTAGARLPRMRMAYPSRFLIVATPRVAKVIASPE